MRGALANASNGGLSLAAYNNSEGHGHVVPLSVGENAGKGELANVGRRNGFLPIGPETKGSVFYYKSTMEKVKFYTLSPTVTPKSMETKTSVIGKFKMY